MKLGRKIKLFLLALLFFYFGLMIFLFFSEIKIIKGQETTNITSTPPNFYAWNDLVGWFDFYNTLTVKVTSYKLEGYASTTSIGYFSLDCKTSPIGDICGTSEYGVCNGYKPHQNGTCEGDENNLGNLSGYAWNDTIGWVAFCVGGQTTTCPGYIDGNRYRVTIDSEGDFRGYAWNDLIGWISFNNLNHSGNIAYKVNTSWRATSVVAYLESAIFDTQTKGTLNSIIWQGTLPQNTCVRFQIAVADDPNGPWNYYGPGQLPTSYFPGGVSCASPDFPIKIEPGDRSWISNHRYLRYKVRLDSNLFQDKTPTITNIILNWSP